MTHANPCQCGRPIQDTANICPECVGQMRRHLYLIADRWAELENALQWRQVFMGSIGTAETDAPTARGERKLALATGANINEAAVRARRAATDVVWFIVQVLRDDFDEHGWTFTGPKLTGNRSQDQTPAVARWVASSALDHIAKRANRETAEEVVNDVAAAEGRVYRATNPTGIHWTPVNLSCDMWATSDLGERVPCPGDMWALVGNDLMPDLICDHDETHTIDPKVWERNGWKRRLRTNLDEGGLARLAAKLG